MLWKKARPSDNVKDSRKAPGNGFSSTQKFSLLLSAAAVSSIIALDSLMPVEEKTDIAASAQETHDQPREDPQVAFVRAVLGDTEDTWSQLFKALAQPYPHPTLTLFDNGITSACGYATAAIGPFYCPQSQSVYLDLDFFRKMAERVDNFGEFAQAYVIAHEIGHHVQTRLGLSLPFDEAQRAGRHTAGADGLEVRAELQADCLAGVWAHHAQQRLDWLEPGDMQAALNAAAAFGDDYRRGNQSSRVMPESFTHGTSEQRVRWFKHGFEHARIEQCDTFSADPL